MTEKEKVANLLFSQPLYKRVEVDIEFLENPTDLNGFTFSYYCPIDKSNQTFRLSLEPTSIVHMVRQMMNENDFNRTLNIFDPNEHKYKYIQHYSAKCQLCVEHIVHFLIKVETKSPLPEGFPYNETELNPKQIVQKIGQFPPFEIKPDKDLLNYLTEEDKDNYRKAIICKSQNYGIGAYAYLRRIVEKEFIRIIEDLGKIDSPNQNNIENLISAFRQNHNMSNLIEEIYQYLPGSLKNLGDNPLKVLYSQLSGGLHDFSEEECIEKAEQIDTLLKFVIKRIAEENSEVKSVREALRKIK
jgi:hypothetical protein